MIGKALDVSRRRWENIRGSLALWGRFPSGILIRLW